MYKPSTFAAIDKATKPLAILNRVDFSNPLEKINSHLAEYSIYGKLKMRDSLAIIQKCLTSIMFSGFSPLENP